MRMIWKLSGTIAGTGKTDRRYRCFRLLAVLLSGIAGAILWLIFRQFAFDSAEWLICFAGIPATIYGHFGSLIFLMNLKDDMEE